MPTTPTDTQNRQEIARDYDKLVNMSASELRAWAKDPRRLKASLSRAEADGIQSGFDSLHRIKRRADKDPSDWTASDYEHAQQVVNFNTRMLGADPGQPVSSRVNMSKWEISLRNWGHDPSKPSSPGHAKWRAWRKANPPKAVSESHIQDITHTTHPTSHLSRPTDLIHPLTEGVSMYTSAMVCFYLDSAIADAVHLSDGVPPSELHLTLAVIPDREQYAQQDIDALVSKLLTFAKDAEPMLGSIAGIGRFAGSPSSDGMDVFYLSIDAPGLELVREEIVALVEAAGLNIARDHGYTPHVTLKYISPSAPMPLNRMPPMPITLGTLSLQWGEERFDIPLPYAPLAEAATDAAPNNSEEGNAKPKNKKSHSAWFKKMVKKLSGEGVDDPEALAAYILRRKKAKEEREAKMGTAESKH